MKKACVITLLAASVLSACAGAFSQGARDRNPGPCPAAIILDDASRLVEFEGEPAPEAIAYTAEMIAIRTTCRYFDDVPIRARVQVEMALGRGPAGEARRRDFPYFVAVTRTDRELIGKREFTRSVSLAKGDAKVVIVDIDNIVIPRAGRATSGTNFEIVVGFALTREQTIYNRTGKSLKFPEL
ncbi:MAG: hypothetical protein AAFR11_02945 [Pseudomonadota bacterium]